MNTNVLSRIDRQSVAVLTFERPEKQNALIDEAVALGLRVARSAPEAVEACLHAVQRGLNTTIDEGLAIEAEAFGKMVSTAALRQGLEKFVAAHS
jgi:enoyl-CoA hydratase/carnithine racemase